MSQAVKEILERIEHLSEVDRIALDEQLANQNEADWRRESLEARRIAKEHGIDQAAIDAAVERVRYGSSRVFVFGPNGATVNSQG